MSDIADAEVERICNNFLVDPEIRTLLDHHLQLVGDENTRGEKRKEFEFEEDTSGCMSGGHQNKRAKLREVDYRHTNPELTQLQPVETSQGDQIQYHWTTTSTEVHRHVEQTTECAEFPQLEPIRIESQWTELKQARTQWVELQKVEVEPQWSDCLLVEPPQATPVLLNPVETAQAQYAQIQEVTEVRVVKKIRIYEEIIEETYE